MKKCVFFINIDRPDLVPPGDVLVAGVAGVVASQDVHVPVILQ